MNKKDYIYWLTSNTKIISERVEDEEEEKGLVGRAIDTVQDVIDTASIATGAVPGLNLATSAVGAASSMVDVVQGDYGDAATRGAISAVGLIPGAGSVARGAVSGARGASALAGAGRAVQAGTNAAAAARTGTSAANAVANASKPLSREAIRSRVINNVLKTREGTQSSKFPSGSVTASTGGSGFMSRAKQTFQNMKTKYGPKGIQQGRSIAAGVEGEPQGPDKEYRPSYLDPAEAEVRSNLVGQVSSPTASEKRRERMDPAFSYYGAQQMFRPIGYGMMQENSLNKMVNHHVEKFLKSRQGKKLKSEVSSIAKKVD